jgi:hypothetical protein
MPKIAIKLANANGNDHGKCQHQEIGIEWNLNATANVDEQFRAASTTAKQSKGRIAETRIAHCAFSAVFIIWFL